MTAWTLVGVKSLPTGAGSPPTCCSPYNPSPHSVLNSGSKARPSVRGSDLHLLPLQFLSNTADLASGDFHTSDLPAQPNPRLSSRSTAGEARHLPLHDKGQGLPPSCLASQSTVKVPIHIRSLLADGPLILFPWQISCTHEESTFRKWPVFAEE